MASAAGGSARRRGGEGVDKHPASPVESGKRASMTQTIAATPRPFRRRASGRRGSPSASPAHIDRDRPQRRGAHRRRRSSRSCSACCGPATPRAPASAATEAEAVEPAASRRSSRRDVRARSLPHRRHGRARRRDRRRRDAAGARVRRAPLIRRRRGRDARCRPRPALELSRGDLRDRHVHGEPGAGRGLAPHRVRPQQRPHGVRGPVVHGALQPLRPPRLPGAAERADRRGRDDRGQGRRAPSRARRELRLSLPRRPVRLGGQPHRRPARALARPLRVLDQRTATSFSAASSRSATSRAPARTPRS